SLKRKRENNKLHHSRYTLTSSRDKDLDSIAYKIEEHKKEEETKESNSSKMKEKHFTHLEEKEEC
ncbi:1805_t:CDS:1, partial [Cetraspora pellucida]